MIQGTLMVIPIEESLIYVRALYLKAEGGTIPELKRVIVAHQNEIVMADTLDAAIDLLFGKQGTAGPAAASPAPGVGTPGTTAAPAASAATGAAAAVERPAPGDADRKALAAEALAHYERALAAQRDGNWALYGEEIKKLGEVLKKLP